MLERISLVVDLADMLEETGYLSQQEVADFFAQAEIDGDSGLRPLPPWPR